MSLMKWLFVLALAAVPISCSPTSIIINAKVGEVVSLAPGDSIAFVYWGDGGNGAQVIREAHFNGKLILPTGCELDTESNIKCGEQILGAYLKDTAQIRFEVSGYVSRPRTGG